MSFLKPKSYGLKVIEGFTLIELLVVIGIIGLLSTIVVATLSSVRESARLVGAKHAASTLDHDLGSQTVGAYEFNECSGSASGDSSGNGYTGGFTGTPAWSADTPTGQGCSASFSGGNYFGVGDRDVQDVRTGSATRALWFKTSQVSQSYLFWKTDGGVSNGMTIGIGASGQVNCTAKASGANANIGPSASYNDGKWHFVACILDRDANTLTVIVDGTNRVTADTSFLAGLDLNSVSAAYFPNNLPVYTGLIDGVRMYASSLTISQIQKLYAEGKPVHSDMLAAK